MWAFSGVSVTHRYYQGIIPSCYSVCRQTTVSNTKKSVEKKENGIYHRDFNEMPSFHACFPTMCVQHFHRCGIWHVKKDSHIQESITAHEQRVKCRAERKLRGSRDGNFLVGPKKAVRLRII